MCCFWWRQSLRGKGVPHPQGGGPRRTAEAKEDHGSCEMLSSRARSSSLCIPAVPGRGPHWPLARPWPRPGSRLALGCRPQQLPAPLPPGSRWPLLLPDTLPLWTLSTSPYFARYWSSSGRSIPFCLTSSFPSSSSLYFSTMEIHSSQLNQPSCSLLSKDQHCCRATVHTH